MSGPLELKLHVVMSRRVNESSGKAASAVSHLSDEPINKSF